MQKGLSLQALAAKVEAQRELKRDYVAATRDLQMEVHSDGKTALVVPNQGSFPILEVAHDQIGTHVDIPAKYYDRMRHEEPDLLARNVNTWFSKRKPEERRMIRTLGGDNRSFNSNKYQRIENEETLAAAMPVLADYPGVTIVAAEATERRLYLQWAFPKIEGEVKRGDIVQAGGILSNSEVGLGSISVASVLWRLICLNGLKTPETFRRNHVGRALEEGEQAQIEWSDDTKQADDKTVLLKLRDMVRNSFNEDKFRTHLEKVQGLTAPKITGNPTKAVEVLAKKIGANESEQGSILRALIEGADLSAWGVINAVTAQAHTAKSFDRAVELEAVGGRLVELAPAEWREVLEAE